MVTPQDGALWITTYVDVINPTANAVYLTAVNAQTTYPDPSKPGNDLYVQTLCPAVTGQQLVIAPHDAIEFSTTTELEAPDVREGSLRTTFLIIPADGRLVRSTRYSLNGMRPGPGYQMKYACPAGKIIQ